MPQGDRADKKDCLEQLYPAFSVTGFAELSRLIVEGCGLHIVFPSGVAHSLALEVFASGLHTAVPRGRRRWHYFHNKYS